MATIILGAVGTALGGPIGGAVGAMVGQAIDARLFRGKGAAGPRLTDLAVQTSAYGTPIPQLFGTMRVAGTVVWSTELIETAARDGGGKGRGGGTRYSYSASFAVLLSARPILSVGRIWADGKLLRGAAGDWKTATRFRLHLGNEAQAVDPLIAAARGAVPALRGQAYAVFEELALADFGNRIPSLTFEVTADAAPVDCGVILARVTGGAVRGETGTHLAGYSAYGESLRGVVEGLRGASGAWLHSAGGALALRAGPGVATTLPDAGAGKGRRRVRSLAAADRAPRAIVLQHHDPARDYQVGLQRVRRAGAGAREVAVDLPAAIDAGTAKTIAGAMLARADTERERRTVSLDWRALALVPGDRVEIAGEPGLWRVTETALEAMVLTVELVRIARVPAPAPATSGSVAPAPDLVVGPTILHAFEMLAIDGTLATTPRIAVAAAGTGPGWRGAVLQLSVDGGTSWVPAGATAAPAILGTVVTPPGAGTSTLADHRSVVEVELAHDAMTLSDADAAGLDRGANLAIVGDELLQFATAARIAPRRWRLAGLWRGRRGTEWAIGGAVAGDRFVLLDADAIVQLAVPPDAIGGQVAVMASGVGDIDHPVVRQATIHGGSIAPPSPVHLAVRRDAAGGANLHWVRRSRTGWSWRDGIDASLGEEGEAYAIAYDGAADVRATASGVPVPPGATAVAVRQIGTHARSRPAALTL